MKPLVKLWSAHRRLVSSENFSEPLPYRAWKRAWQHFPEVSRGESLFDRIRETDWDVLLILDACRYDTLRDVSQNAVIKPVRSPASSTPEFLDQAREAGIFDGTTYVSANPQTDDRSPANYLTLIPAHDHHWDDRLDTVLPYPIFETIQGQLEEGNDIVGHFMQPHYPHVCRPGTEVIPVPNGLHPHVHGQEWLTDQGLQSVLASGAVDLSRAKWSYNACLYYIWAETSAFAASLSSEGHRVVVTSDHGELFGERGFVEHPVGVRTKKLNTVPWVVFEPFSKGDPSLETEDQLAALGYRAD